MSRLERRYRRLLFCYPRGYRRERADEIVSTLLELAPPGRTRPAAREVIDLVRHGLRTRLGRPASRGVVVWAGLTAVVCGLFAGALGTRLGWEAARPLPSEAQARAVYAEALPGHRIDGVSRGRALFTVYEQPLSWDNADILLTLDAGEYQLSHTSAWPGAHAPVSREQTLRIARERLSAAGWTLYPIMVTDAVQCAGPPCDPAAVPKTHTLLAARGDTVLTIEHFDERDSTSAYLGLRLERATPWAAYPAGLAAALLGAVAGWLGFGWASRRTEGRRFVSPLATVLYGVALPLWLLPATIVPALSLTHHLGEPHPRWHPMWEWIGLPTFTVVFVTGAVCATLASLLAALPRSRAAVAYRTPNRSANA